MLKIFRLSLTLAALVLVSSCGDLLNPRDRTVGSWEIETFNGQSLPAQFEASGFSVVELLSDQIQISSRGTYTDSYTLRRTDSNGYVSYQSFQDRGFWDQVNSTITFTDSRSGDVASGSISDGRLTILLHGDAYVFRR